MRKNTLMLLALTSLAFLALPLAPRLLPAQEDEAPMPAVGAVPHDEARQPGHDIFVESRQQQMALSSSLAKAPGVNLTTVKALVYDNPDVRRCFLEQGDTLPSRLEINFHLYPGEVISHLAVLHPLAHAAAPALEACLRQTLGVEPRAPSGEIGASITLPFSLRASDAP